MPIAIVASAILFSALLPWVRVRSPGPGLIELTRQTPRPLPGWLLAHPTMLALVQAALIGVAVSAVAPRSEELGWRGLLWSR